MIGKGVSWGLVPTRPLSMIKIGVPQNKMILTGFMSGGKLCDEPKGRNCDANCNK